MAERSQQSRVSMSIPAMHYWPPMIDECESAVTNLSKMLARVINTKGALRKLITYDDHLIPSHQSVPHFYLSNALQDAK